MAGITLLGSSEALQNSVNNIVSEFRLKRQDSGITRRLATPYKLEAHTGTSKFIDYYNQLQAFNLSDGLDMQQGQTLGDNQVAYVPGEVGVQIVMADTTLRRSADPDVMMRAGRIAANAVDLKEDQDGCGQAANFTADGGSGIPGTGGVLGIGSIASARSRLRTGNSTVSPMPAPPPYYGVFHPYSLQSLVGRMIPLATTPGGGTAYTVTGAGSSLATGSLPGWSEDLMRGGVKALTHISDVDIFEDANVSVTGTPDAKNFIFAKEGFIYVLELAPYYAAQRDESLRATELNIVCSYVFGTYLGANYGVYALADATTPTT